MNRRIKRWGLEAGVLLVLAGVGGFVVAASGVVPIKASSGHWAITEWILQFGKRRSVATHTLGMELPALDAPWLVLKGAGHYESGCRPCHGSPEQKDLPIPAAMLPPPPALAPLVVEQEPEELFYIVKHGIKFTGMPAWPASERDDEVRAVVAFLVQLPTLDAGAYRRLVHGGTASSEPLAGLHGPVEPPRKPRAVEQSCGRCHGVDGNGRGNAAFPKLAGQSVEYLFNAMRAYAHAHRHSGIMQPIAAALQPADWRELATYYAELPGSLAQADASAQAGDARASARPRDAQLARGEAIATRGIPERGVPSCMDCHGPGAHRRNSAYPNLAGQYAELIELQLDLFAQGRRGGSPYAHIMEHVATRLSAEHKRDVAAYYASLSTCADAER